MDIKNRPNPNEAFPNPKIPSLCFIKNVVKNPRIIIGDYTYYDDVDGADFCFTLGVSSVKLRMCVSNKVEEFFCIVFDFHYFCRRNKRT